MIIDCHGHYTVLPGAHDAWREEQKAAFKAGAQCPPYPAISDDEIRETIEANQLRLIKERGADMTIFSPRASAMAPHVGDQSVAVKWAQVCNDLIGRVAGLYPDVFAPVCMLPQSPEADMTSSIAELRRCVETMGFIGCNLNPDPGGGHFKHPPLTDEYWFPFYEAMCELDVPAMIHVSGSCNPAMHATGARANKCIADTGIDPIPLMKSAVQMFKDKPNAKILWASTREALNMYQAEWAGCHIITVTDDLISKLPLKGKNLEEYSLDTVKMFYNDAKKAGFSI